MFDLSSNVVEETSTLTFCPPGCFEVQGGLFVIILVFTFMIGLDTHCHFFVCEWYLQLSSKFMATFAKSLFFLSSISNTSP